MNAIGILAIHSIASGIILLIAGVFMLPITRKQIAKQFDITFEPLTAIGVFMMLYFTAAIVLVASVDMAAEGPEMLSPYFE
jgi:uncharacterized membrane protein